MRRCAGLHRNQAVRLFGQEGQNLTPRQLFAENHCPVVMCPVQMENVLCKINADDGSVCHVDASSFYASVASFDDTWHIVMPSGGGIHTISFGEARIWSETARIDLRVVEVPVMVARGWSKEDRRLYTLADNRLAEIAEWDPEMLHLELGELREDFGIEDMSLIGFSADDLADILPDALIDTRGGLTDPDDGSVEREGFEEALVFLKRFDYLMPAAWTFHQADPWYVLEIKATLSIDVEFRVEIQFDFSLWFDGIAGQGLFYIK
jgi:hypothetical protein